MPSDQQRMNDYATEVDKLLLSGLPKEDVITQMGTIVRGAVEIARNDTSIPIPTILRSASAEFQAAYCKGGTGKPDLARISKNDLRATSNSGHQSNVHNQAAGISNAEPILKGRMPRVQSLPATTFPNIACDRCRNSKLHCTVGSAVSCHTCYTDRARCTVAGQPLGIDLVYRKLDELIALFQPPHENNLAPGKRFGVDQHENICDTVSGGNRPHACELCRKDNRRCVGNSGFAACNRCREKGYGCRTNKLTASNYSKRLKELNFNFATSSFPNGDTPLIGEKIEEIRAELQAFRESVSTKLETILDAVHRLTPAANTSHMASVDSAQYTFPSEQQLGGQWDIPRGTWMSN
ncbi:hypothetical protein PILCRDRAFT_14764 [Piloderma croceum F 1598]|uniref:Zn(2)-C6 fungal-type domain-containing protein n=1 Tax=Piloderma croceum (strain F 1598) TaxID=765440 RepID=A0A0C3F239_PILCF|nr:hypothetical protein PILCRDRAFT_14764 [Piloderma croceum F 1598]